MIARKFSACLLVALLTTAAFAFVAFGTSAEQGSADSYGYYWTDSNAPTPSATYSWIDATGGASAGFSYSYYNEYVTVPIGFNFDFYGNTYSSLYISCNGYVQFGSAYSYYYNYPVPYDDGIDNIVAPYWDGLMVNYPSYNSGQVYYQTVGTTPNQQFVVEYYMVSQNWEYGSMTFEVILNETGEIWFQYQSMGGEDGSTATVGIENSDGSMGCQYSYNSPTVSDGLAIMFERGPMGFGDDQSGYASRGSAVYYDLSVTNGQAVTDSFDITLDYSLLGWTVELYDPAWNPLIDHNGNILPDTGDMAPGTTYDINVYVYVPGVPTEQNETTVLRATSYSDPLLSDTVTLTTQTSVGEFGTSHSSWGYDSDSDGDYDSLNVSVSVEMLTGSSMILYTEMYDSMGDYIYGMYTYPSVPAGSQTVEVSFPGEYVYASMDGGPYDVYLSLYDGLWRYQDSDTYSTDPYLYTEFDPPMAMFLPPFSDYARDDDGNGLYDYLVINTTFEVFDPGYYSVVVELYDDYYGDYLGYAENGSYFGAGVHEVQVLFHSIPISESSLDYYCYVDLYLVYDNSTTVDYGNHYTEWYLYSDFEGPGALFVTPFSDAGFDADGDSYYNQVNVTLYIECFETGLYDLEVYVYDPGWNDFATIYETLSLTDGATAFYTVVLDGEAIRLRGISGEYYLEAYLYANDTGYQNDYEWYYTDYYYYYDFDMIGGYIDYVDDYGNDTDLDGDYNEVVIYADIYPYETGDFIVETYLEIYDSGYWPYYDTVSEVVHMEEGVWYEYELVLEATDFLPMGIDAYFYYDMSLMDDDGSPVYSTYGGYTSYYYYDYFDPLAGFEPPYSDYATDDDSDGYYDYLVLELYVMASADGYYDVEVPVYGPWDYYDTYYFELYLEADVVTEVLVEIPGTAVYEQQYSGYWYVYMYLYDHYTSFQYDSDYYSTDGYYYYYDFEPPGVEFDPPHNDYGADTDSDGYYDYMILEIELDCYVAGTYTVYVDLYDYYDDYVTSLESTESMTVGNEDVDFAVEGWILYYNGVSGYFSADLWVEDSDGNVLDYDYISYTVYYYYYWEFESMPAGFYPPHSDYAADDDGDSLYDRLVVNASVEVYESGDYVVLAYLYDDWWNTVHVASGEAYLVEGMAEVQVSFDAWVITQASSDPYYVELYLYDENGNEMDTDGYYLDMYYDQADFDPATPTIESGWAYEPPTVDGTVAAGEWFGAAVVDIAAADTMNGVAAVVYVLNDGDLLYVLIDATGDLTQTDGDAAAMAFDTMNDETTSDQAEDQFYLEASETITYTTHLEFSTTYWEWVTDCAPFDPLLADHEGLAGAVGFGATPSLASSHRIYEFSIPLALLGVLPGETIGFAGLCDYSPMVWDLDGDSYDSYSTWPVYFEDVPPLSMYGDLVLSEEPPLTEVSLSGTAGEEGWFVSDVEVTLTATGGTGGVDDTFYSVDGGDWQTYSAPFVIGVDGSHTVQYYSTDVGGNEEPVRAVQVDVDTFAPETAASAEGTVGADDWITSAATIEFDVTETASGVAFTMYRLDGGDWTVLAGSSLDVAEDGEHTLEFYSIDVAGNEEAASSIDFKVDANGPVTGITVDGSTVTLTPVDAASGVATTFYRIDGGIWMTYLAPFEVKGEGNHTVEYYSIDTAGNNETVKSAEVEGKVSGLLGIDTWIWIVLILVVVAVVVVVLLLMKRKPGQPVQMVPGEAVVQQGPMDVPPPPQ